MRWERCIPIGQDHNSFGLEIVIVNVLKDLTHIRTATAMKSVDVSHKMQLILRKDSMLGDLRVYVKNMQTFRTHAVTNADNLGEET